MSDKKEENKNKEEDNKTPENTRLTRQQIQQNPDLRHLLAGSLTDFAFKRSGKIKRTPPEQSNKSKEEGKKEREIINSENLGAIPKTIVKNLADKAELGESTSVTEIKIDKQESPRKQQKEDINNIEISNTEQATPTSTVFNQNNNNNDSLLNITLDYGKEDRYSDIGGYLAEQSLILGTRKDLRFNTDRDSKPSTSSDIDDIKSLGDEQNLVDWDENLTERSSISTDTKQDYLDTVNIDDILKNDLENQSLGNTGNSLNNQSEEIDNINFGKNPIIQENNIIINNINYPNTNMVGNQGEQPAGAGNNPPPQPLKLSLKDLAVYVPEYDGKNMSPAEYIEKLKQVKSLVDEVDERNLTSLLKVKMKGEAGEALRNSAIVNIDQLIKGVRTLYPIEDDIHELYAKVRKIMQGGDETVVQYTNRLRKLVLKIKELRKAEGETVEVYNQFENELDRDAARSYKKGLKPEIKYELGQEATLPDISKAAIEIESDIKRRRGINYMRSTINHAYEKEDCINEEENSKQLIKVMTCQICRDYNHEALFCRLAGCVYCKEGDHFSNNCRNVTDKIKLICKYCSQPGHSISVCRLNKKQNNHCQYCQEMGHDASQCPYIRDYEVCWKCKEPGHNPNICTNKSTNNVEKCDYCDGTGHTVLNCPDVVCTKCNKKGHPVKFCKVGEGRSHFRICTICAEMGHEEVECEKVKILVAEYKAKQQMKCQMCEEMGHTAKFCNKIKNNQQTYQNNNSNYNRGFQKKFCEYCKMTGHVIKECRKLMALENRGKPKRTVCAYCNQIGHNVDNCEKIKMLQREQQEFCSICKNTNHTEERCLRNKNKQENYNTLPGGSA